MPVNAVEITLTTLILFFTSSFLISFFRFLTNSNNYNQFVLQYLSNNVDFCIEYSYLYSANIYCQPSQMYSSIVSGIGKYVFVQYVNIGKDLFLANNSLFVPVYGVKLNSFFITYYGNGTNIKIIIS